MTKKYFRLFTAEKVFNDRGVNFPTLKTQGRRDFNIRIEIAWRKAFPLLLKGRQYHLDL